MTTNVYVDGFNLYYGALRGTPYRWLDLEALCRGMLPNDTIKRIRYFSARVSGKANPSAPLDQAMYLRALRTLPPVSLHFGHFLSNEVWMPLAPPPATGPRKVRVTKVEEKGSDVNIATFLLLDAFKQDCDTAVLISNDSDLTEPLRVARYELGLTVGVLNPHPPAKRSHILSADANFFKQIRPGALASAQFSPTLSDARGGFRKPTGW